MCDSIYPKFVENVEYNFLLKISFERKFILKIYVHVNLVKSELVIDILIHKNNY